MKVNEKKIKTGLKRKAQALLSLMGASLVLPVYPANALWSTPRCVIQCTKRTCSNDSKRVSNCQTNCENDKITACLTTQSGKPDTHKKSRDKLADHKKQLQEKANKGDVVALTRLKMLNRRENLASEKSSDADRWVD
jgi:hypothetical protein